MKKLFLILTAIASMLISCTITTIDKPSEQSKRIVGKEEYNYLGITYQIIEVDGIEYLTSYHGGMCQLNKDTLK